jgi:hypothetical protein
VPIPRITLLVIVLIASNTVFADPVDEIRAAQALRFEATLSANVEELDECYADDLVYAHSDGRVEDRGILLANIASGRVDYQKIEIVEQGIRVYDGVAIITGSADFQVVVGDQVNEMTLSFTSIYVQNDGRWQFASWHSSRVASAG